MKIEFRDILNVLLARDFGDEALIFLGLSKWLWTSDKFLSIACNHEIGLRGETRLGRQCRLICRNLKQLS
jgi:hypothetical protein